MALIPAERFWEKGGEKREKKKNACHEKIGCTAI
jgi:hypothetical protein